MLLNLFSVESRGTRSHNLVYRSRDRKYDFMHKMTSLTRSGAKVRLRKMMSLNNVSLKVLIPINWLINPRIFM